MDNRDVLVCSQSVIIRWQSGEELVDEAMIQSDISVMKSEEYRSVGMVRPSFWSEDIQQVIAGVKVGNDIRHIQSKFVVKVIGSVVAVKQAKADSRRQRRGVTELGFRPAIVAGLQLECLHAKVLLQILERALHMKNLSGRRTLLISSLVFKLGVPADHGGFSRNVCRPPWPRRRIQVRIHVCPSVAFDIHYTCIGGVLDALSGGGIVLMQSVVIGEILNPGRNDTFRLPIDISRVHL